MQIEIKKNNWNQVLLEAENISAQYLRVSGLIFYWWH